MIKRLRFPFSLLPLLSLTLLMACGSSPGPGGTSPQSSPAEVWVKTCSRCHGADGRGTPKIGKKLNMRSTHWQDNITDAKIIKTIERGKRGSGGIMAPYKGRLSAEQIDGLMHYIREELGGRKPPAPVPPETPTPSTGAAPATSPAPSPAPSLEAVKPAPSPAPQPIAPIPPAPTEGSK